MIPTSMSVLGWLGLAFISPSPSSALELHDHAALVAAARTLASAHPEHVQVFSVAESRAGRDVIGLRIGARKGSPVSQPALLVVAGLDGARAYTSSLALDHAMQLAVGYGENEAVTALLDSTTVYIIPRLDVDACEARFLSPLAEVSGTGFGVDNDRDGRFGEDGPSDVNGDGYVTVMRQLDPQGEWIEDPTDARAMKKAEGAKGERGRWKLIVEGLDSDGDELVAEDPALDAVQNRNFPRNWTEHAASSGRYPTDEPIALGMVEFLLEHRDIALVLTYGEEGNLVEKPESQDDGGANRGAIKTGVYKSDLPIYEELGERYRKLTSNATQGVGEQPGSFQAFVYHHRGLPCLDIDPWSVPLDAKLPAEEATEEATDEDGETEAPEGEAEGDKDKDKRNDKDDDKKNEPKPTDDAKRLIWLDQNVETAFLPWTEFDHPQLGALEIGGFLPYSRVEPPAAQLAELTAKHFEFLLTLGAYLPRLELVEVEGKSLGGGLVEITAALENDVLLPQQTQAAEHCRAIRPARVSLKLPEGAQLVGGSPQDLVGRLSASGGRKEFRWLIAGVNETSEIRIEVSTDNAGSAGANVEVK